MSNASCQLPDAFEALVAQKHRLHLFLFGDVSIDHQDRSRVTCVIDQQRPPARDDNLWPPFGRFANFPGPLTLLQEDLFCRFERSGIFTGHLNKISANCLLRGPPEEPFRALVPILNSLIKPANENSISGQLQEVGLLLNLMLCPLSLGNERIQYWNK